MSPFEWTIAIVAVTAGACAQGAIGFGLGLLAAPILAILDPDLVPGPLLLAASALTVMVAIRERGQLDLQGVKWAVIGRIPGSAVGALAVATLPHDALLVVFAVLVLAAVALSVGGWRVEPAPTTLFAAGATSGLMGSITSIGGPPMAIVYQHRSGPELRATLALYFVFGSLLSVGLLTAVGEMGLSDVGAGLLLMPPVVGGFVASRSLARWLDSGLLRPVLLAFSACAAVLVLVLEFA